MCSVPFYNLALLTILFAVFYPIVHVILLVLPWISRIITASLPLSVLSPVLQSSFINNFVYGILSYSSRCFVGFALAFMWRHHRFPFRFFMFPQKHECSVVV